MYSDCLSRHIDCRLLSISQDVSDVTRTSTNIMTYANGSIIGYCDACIYGFGSVAVLIYNLRSSQTLTKE